MTMVISEKFAEIGYQILAFLHLYGFVQEYKFSDEFPLCSSDKKLQV